MADSAKSALQKRLPALGVTGILALNLFAAPAFAARFEVDNTSDDTDYSIGDTLCRTKLGYCTLRAAIQEANALPGTDTIVIKKARVDLNVVGAGDDSSATGDLDITDSVNIEGQSPDGATLIYQWAQDRVLHVLGGATVSLSNIIIEHGYVRNNYGAGVYLQGGKTELTNVTIQNCIAEASTEPTFTPGDSIVNPTAPTNITEVAAGGGLYVDTNAEGSLVSSLVQNNSATSAGGGIDSHGRLTIRGSTIYNNTTPQGTGGGVRNFGGYLNVAESKIYENHGGTGGGVYNINADTNVGNANITTTEVYSNHATQLAGGIFNAGPLSLSNMNVSLNDAAWDGGGIYNAGLGSIDLVNVTISLNKAVNAGGGILNSRTMELTNATVYGNSLTSSVNYGQQIHLRDSSSSTFSDNRPSLTLANTIIANSPGTIGNPCAGTQTQGSLATVTDLPDYYSLINSLGGNIESADTCNLSKDSSSKDHFRANISDILKPELGYNPPDGSSTIPPTKTHALVLTNPSQNFAINGAVDGLCPSVDQRFLLRDNACDIGAYEANASEVVDNLFVDIKVTITDKNDPVAPNDQFSPLNYTITVQNLYDNISAADVVMTLSLPASVGINYIDGDQNHVVSCSIGNPSNSATCSLGNVKGLDTIQIFANAIPREEGTVTAVAEANPGPLTPDAFTPNNRDTEDTRVTTSASNGNLNNFNGGHGGGGTLNMIWLALLPALALRRRGGAATRRH